MKYIYIFFIILFITSCGNESSVSEVIPVDMETYNRDKKTIENDYIENVEYFRLYHLYDDNNNNINHYETYPQAKYDPANFYAPYGCDFIKKEHKYVNSLQPVRNNIKVKVDTIIYDSTATLFVAFLWIENRNGKDSNVSNYDSRAMIGFRNRESGDLKSFPLTNFFVTGMDNKDRAINLIKKDYMHNLKGTYISGSIYGDNKFEQNVGDKDFFEKSIFFEKYDSTHYLFQMYKDIDGIKQYNYHMGN